MLARPHHSNSRPITLQYLVRTQKSVFALPCILFVRVVLPFNEILVEKPAWVAGFAMTDNALHKPVTLFLSGALGGCGFAGEEAFALFGGAGGGRGGFDG